MALEELDTSLSSLLLAEILMLLAFCQKPNNL